MYSKFSVYSFFIVGTMLIVLCSCTELEPIYASIENEELIHTSNFPDEATILGMAKMNDRYLVSTGGAVYYRGINSSTWHTISLPSGYDGSSRIVEVTPNAKVYAILIKNYHITPKEYALFEIVNNGSGVGFNKIRTHSTFVDIAVSPGEDNVFAMVEKGEKYEYYAQYQASTPDLLTIVTPLENDPTRRETEHTAKIIGVSKFGTTGSFYLANEYGVFQLDEANNELNQVNINIDGTTLQGYIGGIYYSTLYDTLYVSHGRVSEEGSYIWASKNPTNDEEWTRSKKHDAYFTNFIDIDQGGFTGVLVGEGFFRISLGKDNGYREMPQGDINSLVTPTGNKYTSGKLDTAKVLGFYVDGATHFVFTKVFGLWRGSYGSSRDIDWFLE